MMNIKSLTIELDVNQIELTKDIRKVNIGEVMTKYNFSIVEKSNNEKLSMIADELLEYNNIIIGFACFNLNEIIQINNQLKKNETSLDTVYIPSKETIEKRLKEGKENARLHGRWIGSSEEEVEQRFTDFRNTLQEIIDGLEGTTIKVESV